MRNAYNSQKRSYIDQWPDMAITEIGEIWPKILIKMVISLKKIGDID